MKKTLCSILLGMTLLLPAIVTAQENNSSLTVSPALTKLDLSVDQPEVDISYTNNSNQAIQLNFQSQDFTYLDQGWEVRFIDSQDAANYHYSLSSWMHFESPDLILNPAETRKLKVTIDKDRVTPGGHYGAIVAQVKSIKSSKLALEAAVSSLILVRSGSGNEIEEANIDSIDPIRSNFQYPSRFVVRFRDSGNVDLTPYGAVEVTDPTGQKIAKGIFNEGSLITLPESIRRYDVVMSESNQFLLPGEYSVHAVLHFGKSNKYIEKYNHFFSLGSISFTEIGLAFILLISFWVGFRKIKAKKSPPKN